MLVVALVRQADAPSELLGSKKLQIIEEYKRLNSVIKEYEILTRNLTILTLVTI